MFSAENRRMRSTQAFGITVCALLSGQFGCSSSDEGKSRDGSPDLIELVDRPLSADGPTLGDGLNQGDSSPDLIELVDKPQNSDLRPPLLDAGLDSSPIDGSHVDQTAETSLDGAVGVDGDHNVGETRDNPCAACTANQICVQHNDGTCHTTVQCKTISDACRSKLASSGGKSCTSLSECESEFCLQAYRCVYSIPCGNEIPEAAVYCYGV
jgi:hypothetical protein